MDQNYINETERRVQEYLNDSLKIRPLGKEVHKPTGKEKISQNPFLNLTKAKP
jgi:adenine-specific DNA-methyltransferase